MSNHLLPLHLLCRRKAPVDDLPCVSLPSPPPFAGGKPLWTTCQVSNPPPPLCRRKVPLDDLPGV